VSGRAGRSKDKGSVIIQTNHPDNPAVIKAKRADYESFYDFEIKSRKQTLFPPFSRFCVIEFASPDYHQVRHGSTIFRNALPNHPSIIAFDPIEPFLAKVKDTYRILVPLKGLKEQDPGGAILRNSIRAALTTLRNEKLNKLTVKVDIDSYSVM
jgi:primosomal protein N' (replication factor Y)